MIVLVLLAWPDDATDDFIASAQRICRKEGVTLNLTHQDVWWQMLYEHRDDTIHINLSDEYFRDPAAAQTKLFRLNFYSTGHPDHLIRHELGHRRYIRTCGEDAYRQLLLAPCPLPKDRVRQTVSDYATRNAGEFLAECFVATYYGRELPEDVRDAYRKLWRTP